MRKLISLLMMLVVGTLSYAQPLQCGVDTTFDYTIWNSSDNSQQICKEIWLGGNATFRDQVAITDDTVRSNPKGIALDVRVKTRGVVRFPAMTTGQANQLAIDSSFGATHQYAVFFSLTTNTWHYWNSSAWVDMQTAVTPTWQQVLATTNGSLFTQNNTVNLAGYELSFTNGKEYEFMTGTNSSNSKAGLLIDTNQAMMSIDNGTFLFTMYRPFNLGYWGEQNQSFGIGLSRSNKVFQFLGGKLYIPGTPIKTDSTGVSYVLVLVNDTMKKMLLSTFLSYSGGGGGYIDTTNFWDIRGNTGIGNATFLGTLDSNAIRFQVNGTWAGHISATTQSVSLGVNGLGSTGMGAMKNSSFGVNNLTNITTGADNTSMGYEAMPNISTSSYNTAIGSLSLTSLNDFDLGSEYNVGLGYRSGKDFNFGSNNVFIGANASADNDTLNDAIALGANALVTKSNQLAISNNITEIKAPLNGGSTGYVITFDAYDSTWSWQPASGGGSDTTIVVSCDYDTILVIPSASLQTGNSIPVNLLPALAGKFYRSVTSTIEMKNYTGSSFIYFDVCADPMCTGSLFGSNNIFSTVSGTKISTPLSTSFTETNSAVYLKMSADNAIDGDLYIYLTYQIIDTLTGQVCAGAVSLGGGEPSCCVDVIDSVVQAALEDYEPVNIYNTDGTLTGDRVLDGNAGAHGLRFLNLNKIRVNATNPSYIVGSDTMIVGSDTAQVVFDGDGINLIMGGNQDLEINSVPGDSNQVLTSHGNGLPPTWEYTSGSPFTSIVIDSVAAIAGAATLTAHASNIIVAAGAVTSATLTLPSTPANLAVIGITLTQTVGTLSFSGGTVVGFVTSSVPVGAIRLQYFAARNVWYQF